MPDSQNLNDLPMKRRVDPFGERYQEIAQEDYSVDAGSVAVYFAHLEDRLIEEIGRADAVFGCVAWLKSERILTALASKQDCSIVVNKDDWSSRTRRLYSDIKGVVVFDLPSLSFIEEGIHRMPGVLCVGSLPSPKSADGSWTARPLMHHKFVVFCKTVELEPGWPQFQPYAVWTGSFNFTDNASRSKENAVVIREKAIARAYLKEWMQCLSLSQSLDRKTPQADPEFLQDSSS